MTEFGTVTQVGRRIFLGVSHIHIPKGRGPASPNFLWLLPTPKCFDLWVQPKIW